MTSQVLKTRNAPELVPEGVKEEMRESSKEKKRRSSKKQKKISSCVSCMKIAMTRKVCVNFGIR
jgi:hypothetical protein